MGSEMCIRDRLCNHLTSRKYKIGVISGGYKTNNPYDLQIVGDGAKVEDVGDEAILIKKSSKAIVCKCKDRKKAYEYLVKQFDLDIIISDDFTIKPKHTRIIQKT